MSARRNRAESGRTSRARRDPRAERAERGGGAVRSTARAGDGRADSAAAEPRAAPEVVHIPDPACWVLVVPDQVEGRLSDHDRDAFGAARALADARGGAVVALVPDDADDLGAAGADRVMRLGTGRDGAASDGYAPEVRAAAALAAIGSLRPRHVVLPDTPHGGGDLGRRIAAALGEAPAANVVRLDDDERIACRGDGGRCDFMRAPPQVVLIAPEGADPVTRTVHEAAPISAPEFQHGVERIVDLGPVAVDPATVPLAEAELILSAGAGVEDWTSFHALAAALGASEGGSRVVCDAGGLSRDRQVGASGTLVSARGYIAFGISGAPQHLEGIKGCDCVIAVNIDAHAEIVRRADLAVIGDAQNIMPALLRRLDSGPCDDG